VPRAVIGLGANLGDREEAIGRALSLIARHEEIDLVAVSEVRETEPVGFDDQPRFLNAACAVDTQLAPLALLEALLAIERTLGRTRGEERYGPRTIDLDLLLYGADVIDDPGLTVPHPRVHERRFALEPMLDLDLDLVVPGHGRVDELLAELDA
jgi:2-amino-4-hydroxy-6-hydroxymethyldihydropteridine diphosphokinase